MANNKPLAQKLVKEIIDNKNSDAMLIAWAYHSSGVLYYQNNLLDSATEAFKSSAMLYFSNNEPNEAWLSLAKAGVMLNMRGLSPDAFKLYKHIKQHVNQNSKAAAYVLNQLGTFYHYNGQTDSAFFYYQKSAETYYAIADTIGGLRPDFNAAVLLFDLNNVKKALPKLETIEKLQQRFNTKVDLSFTYEALTNLHLSLYNTQIAIDYIKKAIQNAEEINDLNRKISLLITLGNTYENNRSTTLALKHYKEAKELMVKANLVNQYLFVVWQISKAKLNEKNYNEALQELAKVENDPVFANDRNLPPIFSLKAEILLELNQDTSALRHGLYALELSQKFDNNPSELGSIIILAQIYNSLKKYNDALNLIKLVDQKRKIDNIDYVQQVRFNTIKLEALSQTRQYQEATLVAKKILALKDSLNNEEKIKESTRLIKDFEYEKALNENEQRVLLTQAKITATKNLFYSIGGGLIVLLIVLAIFLFLQIQRKREIQSKNVVIETASKEINKLYKINEAVINCLSHDLKEPMMGLKILLNQIKIDDAYLNDAKTQLSEQISAVNGILKNLLILKKGNSDTTIIGQQDIMAVLNELVQYLHTRLEQSKLQIQIEANQTQANLNLAKEKLFIILLNLLSNAIKFSQENSSIKVFVSENSIQIINHGKPIATPVKLPSNQIDKGNMEGLGLPIIDHLLQGSKVQLTIEPLANNNTSATLYF